MAAMERLKAMKGEHHLKQSIERDDLGKLNSYTGVRPSSYRKSHQGACSSSRMSSPGVHSREPGIHRAVYSAGKPKSSLLFNHSQLSGRAHASGTTDAHFLWEEAGHQAARTAAYTAAGQPPKRQSQTAQARRTEAQEREMVSRRLAGRLHPKGRSGDATAVVGEVMAMEAGPMEEDKDPKIAKSQSPLGRIQEEAEEEEKSAKQLPQAEEERKVSGGGANEPTALADNNSLPGAPSTRTAGLAAVVTGALTEALTAFNTFREHTFRSGGLSSPTVHTMPATKKLGFTPSSTTSCLPPKEEQATPSVPKQKKEKKEVEASSSSSSSPAPATPAPAPNPAPAAAKARKPSLSSRRGLLAASPSPSPAPTTPAPATTTTTTTAPAPAAPASSGDNFFSLFANALSPAPAPAVPSTTNIIKRTPYQPRPKKKKGALDSGFVRTSTPADVAKKKAIKKEKMDLAMMLQREQARAENEVASAAGLLASYRSSDIRHEMRAEAAREMAARRPQDGALCLSGVKLTADGKRVGALTDREMQLTSRWQLSDARPDGSFSSYRKPLTKRGPNGKRVPVEAWNDLHGGTARARWGRQYSSPPKCGTVLEDEAMARPRIFVDYSSGRVAIERPDWSAGQLMEPWA